MPFFFCTGIGCWGRGSTPQEALKLAWENRTERRTPRGSPAYHVWEVDDRADIHLRSGDYQFIGAADVPMPCLVDVRDGRRCRLAISDFPEIWENWEKLG